LLDTHASLGFYDLQHANAQKTQEYKSGIERILEHEIAPLFKPYIDIVNKYQHDHHAYPGSGAIMHEYLRDNDRLILNELHPEDYRTLIDNFKGDRRVKITQQDAYISVKALLPPKERRGLILIDPPYEQADEFFKIVTSLKEGLKRFATGIYAIWYPIKDRKQIANFYRDLATLELKNSIGIELHANDSVLEQLHSCGMVIINPPWKLREELETSLPALIKYLELSKGTFKLFDFG
jgi:23S rRNA (adenine2030-N6)-methyltransferase